MAAGNSLPVRRRRVHALVVAGLLTLLVAMTSDRGPFTVALVQAQRPATVGAGSRTATEAVQPTSAGADGTDLAGREADDPALRRTLVALRRQVLDDTGHRTSSAVPAGETLVVGGSVADIPAMALAAYRRAAGQAGASNPGCHLPWNLLAGIGRVESDHGLNAGSRPDAHGVVHPAILGPVLDGANGTSAIPDTDQGRYDGDTRWDRAVGPMQFIPSTWATSGRDGDGDGVADPENLFDAALAAGDYLCHSGGDLRTVAAAREAVLTYNHSWDYVLVVLGYSGAYAGQDVSALTAYLRSIPAPTAPRRPAGSLSPTPTNRPKTLGPSAYPSASTSIPAGPTTSPSPSPQPTPSPTPVAAPTPTPSVTPLACPSPLPTVSPSPSATPSAVPAPSPTAVGTSPTPTPTPSCV
jgi:membrane-bound lytic murein transglycosylase B